MNRGAFERQLLRLDDGMHGLRSIRLSLLMKFATGEELVKGLELLNRQANTKGPSSAKTATEDMVEIRDLFKIWYERLKAKVGEE